MLKKLLKIMMLNIHLIGSITYISISSILMRVSQFYRIPVIYVSGESFRIIKNNKDLGDIISIYSKKYKIFKSKKI